jgi:hypothetical protein
MKFIGDLHPLFFVSKTPKKDTWNNFGNNKNSITYGSSNQKYSKKKKKEYMETNVF